MHLNFYENKYKKNLQYFLERCFEWKQNTSGYFNVYNTLNRIIYFPQITLKFAVTLNGAENMF